MRFQGRTALITAGGRGIGRATAEIIGREGGTVIAVDLDKESLDQVVGAIRVAGGTAHAIVADALDASQVAGVVRRVVEEHGRIDILVNAIGPSLTLSPRLRPRWDAMSPEERARQAAQVPLGRVAEPVDQARVICFLASSDADFVTGVTIDVNGGSRG